MTSHQARARGPGRWLRLLWTLGLALGALLIGWASRVYFDADELAPFVIEKLPLPQEALWLAALKAHVVAASLSLPACLLLALPRLLRFPRLHRWLGRGTGAVLLGVVVPSGLYLSLFAKGGLPATAGFVLSGVVVAWAMGQGIRRARRRDYAGHRRCMRHVVAQLSVAVTSRALLYCFDALGVDPERAYLIALWGPVLAGLVLVERSSHALQVARPASPRAGGAHGPARLGRAA